MQLTSKEIKKYILNYNDLNILYEFLDNNSKETLYGIFNAIPIMLKNKNKCNQELDYLIYIIESKIKTFSPKELNIIKTQIIELQNKVSRWDLKERININKTMFQLQNIFNEINIRQGKEKKKNLINCLKFYK